MRIIPLRRTWVARAPYRSFFHTRGSVFDQIRFNSDSSAPLKEKTSPHVRPSIQWPQIDS